MGKAGLNKLNRFNKGFAVKQAEEQHFGGNYFDQSYLEADRILYCTEIFSIIHPKKSRGIKHKWYEHLPEVLSQLLNYSKDGVYYGVYFMDPVEEENADYYKRVKRPMDLGTLNNRIYLENVKNFQDFWFNLGLVFRNCREYNYDDEQSDIRILCDTLREMARGLYKAWYQKQSAKYDQIRNQLEEDMGKMMGSIREKKEEMTQKFSQEFDLLIQKIWREIEQGVQALNQKNTYKLVEIKQQLITDFTYIIAAVPQQGQRFQALMSSIDEIFEFDFEPSLVPDLLSSINQRLLSLSQDSKSIYVEALYQRFVSNTTSNANLQQIEVYHPGEFSLDWLKDYSDSPNIETEELVYWSEADLNSIKCEFSSDKVYLIKWKNLSYVDATWEKQSLVSNFDEKLQAFELHNKALVKELRQSYQSLANKHRFLLDLRQNSRKLSKTNSQVIDKARQILYNFTQPRQSMYDRRAASGTSGLTKSSNGYEILTSRFENETDYKTQGLFQYTMQNQPVFKNYSMLKPYQLSSLNFLIKNYAESRNTILADEMGLGKTIQTIAFLNFIKTHYQKCGIHLVVAPLSTLGHWKKVFEDWTNLNSIVYYDSEGLEGRTRCRALEFFHTDISMSGKVMNNASISKLDAIVTSYEVFLQDIAIFQDLPITQIVVDEAHRLKNKDSKLFKGLNRLPCERILLLTGTPVQNNTQELWSLLHFIEPEKFSNQESFFKKYGDLNKVEHIEELHKEVKPYLLRRTKEQVESSIPPLQETIIDIEMTTFQKKVYVTLYEKNKKILVGGAGNTGNVQAGINNLEMQLRKCCNHPLMIKEVNEDLEKEPVYDDQALLQRLIETSGKMILLDKLLKMMKEKGSKVLIFSQFTHMLDLLETYLKLTGYKFEKIDGSVKAKDRQNSIDRFNNPDLSRDVFLLSTKAGGMGINLTSANTVVIFDSDWNPQNDVQACARAHRIGQQSEVKVYRLITKRTYEAEMFERSSKKLGLDQAIFMGGAFDQTKQVEEGDEIEAPKFKKEEIEMLLKKGLIGMLKSDEGDEEELLQKNQSIEEILASSRTAKYSVLNGSYTFNKSSFQAEEADSNLRIDDPNFWNIVLKNTETSVQKLEKMFSNHQGDPSFWEDIENQKRLINSASDQATELIESKKKGESISNSDEEMLVSLLNQITSNPYIEEVYKTICTQIISEIYKPTRRYKNLDLEQAHEQATENNGRILLQRAIEQEKQRKLAEAQVKAASGSKKNTSKRANNHQNSKQKDHKRNNDEPEASEFNVILKNHRGGRRSANMPEGEDSDEIDDAEDEVLNGSEKDEDNILVEGYLDGEGVQEDADDENSRKKLRSQRFQQKMLGGKGKQVLKPKIQKIIPKKSGTGVQDGSNKQQGLKEDQKTPNSISKKKKKKSTKSVEKPLKLEIGQSQAETSESKQLKKRAPQKSQNSKSGGASSSQNIPSKKPNLDKKTTKTETKKVTQPPSNHVLEGPKSKLAKDLMSMRPAKR